MNAPAVLITDWKPLRRNTLQGFATASMPSGMVLHDVAIHYRAGSWWAVPASKPMLSADGTILRDERNKIRYAPIVSFDPLAAKQRFSNAIIEALRRVHPEVFAEAEAAS